MRRFLLLSLASAVVAAVLAAPAAPVGNSLGPPSGTIYAFDQAYRTIGTPTSLPNRGPSDTLYMFPDCPTCWPFPTPLQGIPATTVDAGRSCRPSASRAS